MAQYNQAISVTFNDNDGGVSWQANPESGDDVLRYHKIFGKWRARWIFFKRFWAAMTWLERQSGAHIANTKLWVFKSEIPE